MRVLVVAVVVGGAVGLLLGGRLRSLGEPQFRRWPLLFVGLGLQLVAEWAGPFDLVTLLASYVCLLIFCLVNLLNVRGMAIVLIGVALNATVIAVNESMPVRRSALYAADVVDRDWTPRQQLDHKHHLERPDDSLMVLADIIPVPPLREVVSFGDLIMAVGMANVLTQLLRPRRWRARRAPALAAIDLDASLEPYRVEHVVDLAAEERRLPTSVS